ncbi:hypothetical protein FV226_22160 [Methylobacterium sp. WL12]|uniref:hypothetical protein n=1 Tax=Methylobacterium sp. WL12 TaxID=2603890 RepID=UPI0011C87459|nr:hypothetical protein [Methylobacterium sp. WL12]TXM67341.1 hypothetical protein FV226_22160 [Methylobacterium sp. WL12]
MLPAEEHLDPTKGFQGRQSTSSTAFELLNRQQPVIVTSGLEKIISAVKRLRHAPFIGVRQAQAVGRIRTGAVQDRVPEPPRTDFAGDHLKLRTAGGVELVEALREPVRLAAVFRLQGYQAYLRYWITYEGR